MHRYSAQSNVVCHETKGIFIFIVFTVLAEIKLNVQE